MSEPLILSHESALLYHRAARVAHTRGHVLHAGDIQSLADEIGADAPLDVSVSAPDERVRGAWTRSHVCPGIDLASHAIETPGGLMVCTPELALWQLAQRGDPTLVALLAYELCGTFAMDPSIPDGFVRTRMPLTSRSRLEALAREMPGSPRSRHAITMRSALDSLVDGAASPAEAKLALAMVTSRLSGGFGLPRPTLNSPIVVSEAARGLTEKRTVYPDALWEPNGLILEYQGSYHSEPGRIESDAGRDNALLALGYRVIHVTRRQVYNYDLYLGLMEAIRLALGVRLGIPSQRMLERRRSLWKRLYAHDDVW